MKKLHIALIIILIVLLSTCKENSVAVLWSNRIEFASYCELFNSSQDKYKIILEYKKNPAKSLSEASETPDIVVGAWLKGASIRSKFKKLNQILNEDAIDPNSFYPELLRLGSIDNNQYLLPISFNLPTMIFLRDSIKPDDDFLISLDDIRKLSAEYNTTEKNVYTRMGFSPSWNPEFLYITAKGFNTNFEENGKFFTWNAKSLNNAVTYLKKWVLEVNTSTQAEKDFQFKYLYDPPYATVTSNRCLFQYLPSDSLFQMQAENVRNIDFRWLSFNGKTPLNDEVLYAGIYSKAKNKKAAQAFLTWFFSKDVQKQILEHSTSSGLKSYGFGIAGGFSAIKPVTENIFPVYYPLLLSHLPQTKSFMAPNILPTDWLEIKSKIILPYLIDVVETKPNDDVTKFETLNKRISK